MLRIEIEKQDLLSTLELCKKVAGGSHPILQGLLFTLDDGQASITVTNIRQALRIALPLAFSEGSGSFCVDAALLTSKVKALFFAGKKTKGLPGSVSIELSEDGKQVVLKRESFAFPLPTLTKEDFPAVPEWPGEVPRNTLTQATLARLLRGTDCASSEMCRGEAMQSVRLEIEPSGLARTVAVDGHRMSICEERTDCAGLAPVLVPKESAAELQKLVGAFNTQERSVTIAKNGMFHARTARWHWSCTLADGNFPPWDQVRPTSTPVASVECGDPKSFIATVRALVAGRKPRRGILNVELTLEPGEILRITSTDDGIETSTTLAMQCAGEAFKFGIETKYLLDALQSLSGHMKLEFFGDVNSPMLISAIDGSSSVIIMPVALGA